MDFEKNGQILDVEQLSVSFSLFGGTLRVLDEVSFNIGRKEIFGLVGESGSGKTVTSLSVMKLLDPPGKVIGGRARFNDMDLLQLRETEMRKIRGSKISMIFQDARSCLNPFMKIGRQMTRVFKTHGMGDDEARQKADEMLAKVKIPDPKEVQNYYPHQLSGGMAQRVMTAIYVVVQSGTVNSGRTDHRTRCYNTISDHVAHERHLQGTWDICMVDHS